jgi:hypothetical protein
MNLIDMIEKNARLYSNSKAFVEVKPVSKMRDAYTNDFMHTGALC